MGSPVRSGFWFAHSMHNIMITYPNATVILVCDRCISHNIKFQKKGDAPGECKLCIILGIVCSTVGSQSSGPAG